MLEDPELMAKGEDLEVLGPVVSATLATADEETGKHPDHEVEEGQHRPIVSGAVRSRIGVFDPHGIDHQSSAVTDFDEV